MSSLPDDPSQEETALSEFTRILSLRRFAICFIMGVTIALLLRVFVVQMFYIPSESMEPTLEINDRIAVEKWRSTDSVERGDIIVFRDPGGWMGPIETNGIQKLLEKLNLRESESYLVKRVIALPGEEIKCCNPEGLLLIDERPLKEPYLPAGVAPSEEEFRVQVAEGKYWVMGDNRSHSGDSRANLHTSSEGFVDEDDIVGEVLGVFWPLKKWNFSVE